MPQRLKADLRVRIVRAALESCGEVGYERTSVTTIAARAGTSTANLYNYFADKRAIFVDALPAELLDQHDRLVEASIDELLDAADGHQRATALLDFWIEHRLVIATVLGRDEGSPRDGYGRAFTSRLTRRFVASEPAFARPDLEPLVEAVFDNTRSALARILRSSADENLIRQLVDGFWSYQIPGLAGLVAWGRTQRPT